MRMRHFLAAQRWGPGKHFRSKTQASKRLAISSIDWLGVLTAVLTVATQSVERRQVAIGSHAVHIRQSSENGTRMALHSGCHEESSDLSLWQRRRIAEPQSHPEPPTP